MNLKTIYILKGLSFRLGGVASELHAFNFPSPKLTPSSIGVSRRMRIIFLMFISFASPVSPLAFAQDKTGEIDKVFSWTTPESPGCVCAVSKGGELILNRAYGSSDLERNVPLKVDTRFDIGSTRKQFIAAAVLLLAEDKQLALSDDIRKYIPELPDYGHTITVDHLLTHTSGIRDWTGILPLANGSPDALSLILRQKGLNFTAGEEWSYSNSGYVLLTEIVARISKTPFAEFMQKRIFDPLGMKSTTYLVDMTEVVKNRALAYDKVDGRWKLDVYLGNDRGGGAILSTTGDQLIWNDALNTGRLSTFVSANIGEPTQLNNGRRLNYARGLFLDSYKGAQLVSHSGGAAGYHSWLGRYPSQNLSVSVLCNSDAVGATALGHRILDLFISSTAASSAEDGPPPPVASELLADLNSKAGLFFNDETGEELRLAVDRGRFRIANGPGLLWIGKDRFRRWGASVQFMSQDQFELEFLSKDQFVLKSMEGKVTRFTRAQSYTPMKDDLKAFEGRYESAEIGSFFDIAVDKSGLVGRANDRPGPSLPLSPVHPDTFQLGGIIVRFLRDKKGTVIGLSYSNPLIRNIQFSRSSKSIAR